MNRTIYGLIVALCLLPSLSSGASRRSNLRVYRDLDCNGAPAGTAHDLNLTGRQFATLEDLRAFVEHEMAVALSGTPFRATLVGDALKFDHGIDGFVIQPTGDADTVWPLLGFPRMVGGRVVLTGEPIDLDLLNERLRAQFAPSPGASGARQRGHASELIDA